MGGICLTHCNTMAYSEYLADSEEAFPGQGNLKESEKELRRLQRENARLREEREILKKAAAWFARETGSSDSSS